jgi:hypothetical protein
MSKGPRKGPRILGIYASRYGSEGDLRVIITAKQLNRLPEWVNPHINWSFSPDGDSHREIAIEAKDELQAMMRFNKLWAALSTIGE